MTSKKMSIADGFTSTFPAVRGIQSGRPCYIAMCPMRLIPKMFIFNEEEVPADLRAQRKLNHSRIPEIAAYLVDNARDYTLSAITASIDGVVAFEPSADTGIGQNIGTLSIHMGAQILINDGQHRRAAIEEAIKTNPEIGYDNIPVLFFIDEGLTRSQQMFADLNKHAVRPSDSISTLYDHRDSISDLARYMVKNVDIFERMTEMEKSSISNRSTKLFTLSAIKNASKTLLRISKGQVVSNDAKELGVLYWTTVAAQMPDWLLAKKKEVSTAELREQYVHAHAVTLQALGIIGAELIVRPKLEWVAVLSKLRVVDWSRSNSDWEGRALSHGRISKSHVNVALTANYIKTVLGIPLSNAELTLEGGV
ncbi:DNA sulfur modification protein DndB [Pseudomonas sp. R3-57]|uniref:DNA sulfur modification protein DndB n=2 Tax=unclassified Pseudomonas TaxID=196821 RepID=UPI003DAA11B3